MPKSSSDTRLMRTCPTSPRVLEAMRLSQDIVKFRHTAIEAAEAHLKQKDTRPGRHHMGDKSTLARSVGFLPSLPSKLRFCGESTPSVASQWSARPNNYKRLSALSQPKVWEEAADPFSEQARLLIGQPSSECRARPVNLKRLHEMAVPVEKPLWKPQPKSSASCNKLWNKIKRDMADAGEPVPEPRKQDLGASRKASKEQSGNMTKAQSAVELRRKKEEYNRKVDKQAKERTRSKGASKNLDQPAHEVDAGVKQSVPASLSGAQGRLPSRPVEGGQAAPKVAAKASSSRSQSPAKPAGDVQAAAKVAKASSSRSQSPAKPAGDAAVASPKVAGKASSSRSQSPAKPAGDAVVASPKVAGKASPSRSQSPPKPAGGSQTSSPKAKSKASSSRSPPPKHAGASQSSSPKAKSKASSSRSPPPKRAGEASPSKSDKPEAGSALEGAATPPRDEEAQVGSDPTEESSSSEQTSTFRSTDSSFGALPGQLMTKPSKDSHPAFTVRLTSADECDISVYGDSGSENDAEPEAPAPVASRVLASSASGWTINLQPVGCSPVAAAADSADLATPAESGAAEYDDDEFESDEDEESA